MISRHPDFPTGPRETAKSILPPSTNFYNFYLYHPSSPPQFPQWASHSKLCSPTESSSPYLLPSPFAPTLPTPLPTHNPLIKTQMFAITGGGLGQLRYWSNGNKPARHSIDQWDRVVFFFFFISLPLALISRSRGMGHICVYRALG